MERGHIHPISSLIREANRIFFDMGFTFAEGPLVESEWYNFDALNVPKDHPARDMQDTFFVKDEPGMVLRKGDPDAGGMQSGAAGINCRSAGQYSDASERRHLAARHTGA